MKINMSSIKEGLRLNYDKIVVLLVLTLLLFSVASLGYRVIRERTEIERSGQVRGVSAQQPVEPLDVADLKEGLSIFRNPFQTADQLNRMMVAEIRVACANCGKPITMASEKCPFCGAAQQETKQQAQDRELDSDGDGMQDWWETKYRLNPRDPDDAHMDMDGDGFTNLEEYFAGTDTTDTDSHPSPAIKLRLDKVVQRPVYYRFKAASKIGDKHVFTIKDIRTNQDFYRKLGEQVGEYAIVEYDERSAMVDTAAGMVRRDVSILKLEREGRITVLTVRSNKVEGELIAKLVFRIDDKSYTVGVDSEIELMGATYKVVDITPDSVVIKDKLTDKRTTIGGIAGPVPAPAPERAEEPLPF